MRQLSYLNSVKSIISAYDGKEPLAIFLKKHFAANKKFGSKDRKVIAALCYNYFRPGRSLPEANLEERIFTGALLCEHHTSDFLHFHKPEWNELILCSTIEKISEIRMDLLNIFPWVNELSDGIDHSLFCISHLLQPDLFLRVRPGKKELVEKKLHTAAISFHIENEHCLSLTNAVKLDDLVALDSEAVVQDLNSQRVLDFLKKGKPNTGQLHVWDCCAASGGKSILAFDILNGNIALTVSDIREGILRNLKKRFLTAGIKRYRAFIADLSLQENLMPGRQFDIIICDAPCTGSGTWSRTPEQLYFFKQETIVDYARRQKEIITNTIPHLQTNGIFIYVTCSVFKKENEEAAAFIKEQFHLQLLQMELLKGYDKRADTMFVAVFKKTPPIVS